MSSADTHARRSLTAVLRSWLTPGKMMAFLAHCTTAVTFGSAIYAWFYPEAAGEFLARLTRQMDSAIVAMEETAGNTAQTAENTAQTAENTAATAENTARLAEAVADRPRLGVRLYAAGGNSGFQIQFTVQNMLTQPLTDVAIVAFDSDGGAYTSFDVFTVPPLETAVEPMDKPVESVCLSYVVQDGTGTRYTEMRSFVANAAPTRDDMGNAGTYDAKVLSYVFAAEPDPALMICNGKAYALADLRAEKAARAP